MSRRTKLDDEKLPRGGGDDQADEVGDEAISRFLSRLGAEVNPGEQASIFESYSVAYGGDDGGVGAPVEVDGFTSPGKSKATTREADWVHVYVKAAYRVVQYEAYAKAWTTHGKKGDPAPAHKLTLRLELSGGYADKSSEKTVKQKSKVALEFHFTGVPASNAAATATATMVRKSGSKATARATAKP